MIHRGDLDPLERQEAAHPAASSTRSVRAVRTSEPYPNAAGVTMMPPKPHNHWGSACQAGQNVDFAANPPSFSQ